MFLFQLPCYICCKTANEIHNEIVLACKPIIQWNLANVSLGKECFPVLHSCDHYWRISWLMRLPYIAKPDHLSMFHNWQRLPHNQISSKLATDKRKRHVVNITSRHVKSALVLSLLCMLHEIMITSMSLRL